ncbi:MAG: hypothetical protein ACI4KA_09740 [Oscillospiraceae bacterium]
MAKVHLVGLQLLDFPNKDGEQIKGINLHINYDDENVYGKKADTKFLSDILCKNKGITIDTLLSLIDNDIDIQVNLKGKVVGISEA